MKRIAITRAVLALCVMTGELLLPAGHAAAANQATRTAPYDFGCLGGTPCAVQWRPARAGELYGSNAVLPCLTYSLLFPVNPLCYWYHVGSSAGIYATTTLSGGIRVTAVVRGAPVVSGHLCLSIHRRDPRPTSEGLKVVSHLRDTARPRDGGPVAPQQCWDLPILSPQEITTNFHGRIVPRGRYLIFASLDDGTGKAVLESISYQVTP